MQLLSNLSIAYVYHFQIFRLEISCMIFVNSCKIVHQLFWNIRDEFFKTNRSHCKRNGKRSSPKKCVRLTNFLNKSHTFLMSEVLWVLHGNGNLSGRIL